MLGSLHIRHGVRVGLVMMCISLSGMSVLQAVQSPAPDNSKVNARDRKPSQVTADQQKNNQSDLQTTKEIRKALVADKSLSTYAHNVKIVTRDGKVTLKGPVRSDDEKKIVEAKAADVAGATNIINQLSVAPKGRSHRTASSQ
jgi:hyperosmotically inducible periplasmic protein